MGILKSNRAVLICLSGMLKFVRATTAVVLCSLTLSLPAYSQPRQEVIKALPGILCLILCDDENLPPLISGVPGSITSAGIPYSFVPMATDPEGAELAFMAENLPSWAGFNLITGELSGTPGNADIGSYPNILISVTDSTGSSASLPAFSIEVVINATPAISGTPAVTVIDASLYAFTPTSSDTDGDDLTFSISNKPLWASFDTTTGELSGTPNSSDEGLYEDIMISVSDGRGGTADLPQFSITVDTRINVALRAGSVNGITASDIYQAVESFSTTQNTQCLDLLSKIYPNGLKAKIDVDVDPIKELASTNQKWLPLITAENGGDTKIYAYIRELDNGTRIIMSGLSLFNQASMKGNFDDGVDKSEILNMLKWLAQSKGDDGSGTLISDDAFLNADIRIMHNEGRNASFFYGGGGGSWGDLFNHEVWLGNNFNPTAGVSFETDGLPSAWTSTENSNGFLPIDQALLEDTSFDIYMLADPVDATLQTVIDHAGTASPKGIFIHVSPLQLLPATQRESITQVTRSGNEGSDNQLPYGDSANLQALCDLSPTVALTTLADDFSNDNFNYSFPAGNFEKSQNDRWDNDLNGPNLRGTLDQTDGVSFNERLLKNLDTLRATAIALDASKEDLFADADSDANRLNKLMFLLGDLYRAEIVYPMDKATTDNLTFFKALYADNTISYARTTNVAQPDMGSFLDNGNNATKYLDNPAVAAMPTTSGVTRSFVTTKFEEQTAAGVYIPPGKTVTITRTDSETNVQAYVRFNINHLNTKEFERDNGYRRPQMLASERIPMEAGEVTQFSSPHGGPLYIWWDAQPTGPKPTISFQFDNVLLHPYLDLDGTETAIEEAQEIADFTAAFNQNDNFSWADIKTPFAEIHTLGANFDETLNNSTYNGDMGLYVEYLNLYLIAGNYEWAGINGSGLNPLEPDVANFCTQFSLDCTDPIIHAKPEIQHINSDDLSRCGDACAGNPIDFSFGIDPIGQVANHEMGHNLQRNRMMTPNGIEVSNLIFVARTEREFARASGFCYFGGWDQIRIQFDLAFEGIRSRSANGDTPGVNSPWGDSVATGVAFYAQLMWSSTNDDNAWNFYTKMYLLERLYTDAIADENNVADDSYWEARRANLGFSTYTRADAKSINAIDFMSVVSSLITDRDYSDFFAMWGMATSAAAKAQITANTPASIQPRVYRYMEQDFAGSNWDFFEDIFVWPAFTPITEISLSNPATAVYTGTNTGPVGDSCPVP